MIIIDQIRNHPIYSTIIGFAMVIAFVITWHEQTIGAIRNSHIKLLESKNSILEKANSKFKNQLENSIQKKDIFNIAKDAASMIKDIFNDAQSEYVLHTSTVKQDNFVNTEFYLEHKIEFPPGEYSLETAYKASNLIEAITTYAITIKQIYEMGELSKTYSLYAEFEGSADNAGGMDRVGIYNGEFGPIVINSVLVNSKIVDINIYPGDVIKNSDLAFLRSYSIYHSYRKLSRILPIDVFNGSIEFVANENKRHGRKYRYGKISVKILDEKFLKN